MLFIQQGEFRFNTIERASTVGTEDCLEGVCVCGLTLASILFSLDQVTRDICLTLSTLLLRMDRYQVASSGRRLHRPVGVLHQYDELEDV